MVKSRTPVYISIAIFVIFFIPIGFIFYGLSYFPAPEGGTASNFLSTRTLVLLQNTLVYGLGSGFLATILGFIYAWFVLRSNIPAKRLLEVLLLLTLTIPLLLKIFGWIYLFSPTIGVVNTLLRSLGLPGPAVDIFTVYGMILAAGIDSIAPVYLLMRPAIVGIDPALEEASRTSGHSLVRTFFDTTLPLLTPAFLSTFLLVSTINMSLLEVPSILGNGTFSTLVSQIFYWVESAAPPRYDIATQYSFLLIAVTFGFFVVYTYVTRKSYRYVTVTGKASQRTLLTLGNLKTPAIAYCVLILLISFVLPLGSLLYSSFITSGTITYRPVFGLKDYAAALSIPGFGQAALNTLEYPLVVGLIIVAMAVVVDYAALKSNVRGSRLIELFSNIPLVFPGAVYGFALFLMFLLAPGFNVLYGTIWPLIIATSVIFFPGAAKLVASNLIQISNEMEEASRVVGATGRRTFFQVTLTLLTGGLVTAFGLIFMETAREFGTIALLSTGNGIPLTALIFGIYESRGGSALYIVSAASVLQVILLGGIIIVTALLQKFIGHTGFFQRA